MFMPMSVNMEKKLFIVVGGGKVAARRVLKLLEYDAEVIVVSPEIDEKLEIIKERITWKTSRYEFECIENADFVIAATDNEKLNNEIRMDCNKRKISCLDVSNGEKSDFHLPAVLQKGSIQISVSTGGQSPIVAKQLKNEIDEWLEDEWAERAMELSKIRGILKLEIETQVERENILRQINDLSLEDIRLRRQHYENKNRL